MNKKLLIAGTLAVGIVGAASLIPIAIFAQTATTGSNFVSILAQKLGIDQGKVQTAFDQTRDQLKSEHDAEHKADITKAVQDGKLTQRQADILIAMMDVKPDMKPEDRPDFRNLTAEQRQAKMEELRKAHEQQLVDALNQKGLNTNLDELTATMKAAANADLRGPGGPGGFGHGGPRF